MKYTLRANIWLMASHYQKYFMQDLQNSIQNAFPDALNYSGMCDGSTFNVNHYLLLSYSRTIEVITRNTTWDIPLTPLGNPFNASENTNTTSPVVTPGGYTVIPLQRD